MKFALSFGMLNPSAWLEVAEVADELGYDSVWLPEHMVLPVGMGGSPHDGADHPPIPPNIPVFDVFTYLAYLAGKTDGSGSDPRVQHRSASPVHHRPRRQPRWTGSRAVGCLFGIGASWMREEWDAVGLDFDSRGRRVDEAIDVCRRLWSDEVVEHHGEFFDFDPVMFEPKPVQQPLPPPHRGRRPGRPASGRDGGRGWVPMNHSLDELPAAVANLAERGERAGRDPGDAVEVTLGGTPTSEAEVERFAEAGVDRLFVRPFERTSGAVDGLRRFAEQFIPH